MNNIKIIEKGRTEGIINKNKINNICKSTSLYSKEKQKNKINIHLSEKINNRTNENEIKDISNNPSSIKDKLIFDLKTNLKFDLPSINKNINKSPKINNIFNKNNIARCNANESLSTNDFTNSIKKNKNLQNLTEQMSKYRIGLSSANSLSNNNPIIPIIPFNRPISNFNFSGKKLWEIDNNNYNGQFNDIIFEKKNININKSNKVLEQKNYVKNLNKITTRNKSLDMKKKYLNSFKFNNELNNDMPKIKRINVEKGMMSSKLENIFNKKLIGNKINSFRNDKDNYFNMKKLK